jgi:hypothetical protein
MWESFTLSKALSTEKEGLLAEGLSEKKDSFLRRDSLWFKDCKLVFKDLASFFKRLIM